MLKKGLLVFALSLILQQGFAQFKTGFVIKNLAVADTILLDTLSILPNSVRVLANNIPVNNTHYKINFAASKITWLVKPKTDSVQISYSVFPLLFTKKYWHKNPNLIGKTVIGEYKPFVYSVNNGENTVFNFSGFEKSGSIARSIGFGNNQNLTVNSNMVLQLSGKLNKEIEILAAISDDNLPIQPDGNTQQLSDFDKVFIQLKRKGTTFIAGDYELRKPDSYFMNYFKRTQGAYLANVFKDKKQNTYTTQFAGAVAKGRSARNQIAGIEGNQGPYRLLGNNGEQFIIILSGTERVFIDGEVVLRGQDNDYVIDYNTAELTFTTKRLITQNSRISVEFEYSDKVFARSLFYANQNFERKKLKLGFNFYNEQDNPNQPFLQNLSEPQKEFLKTVGNNINQAFYSNANEVSFNRNEILYLKTDTLGSTNVYVYSTDSLKAKYRIGFSFLGNGKGNYKLKTDASANGRVFEFVPPVNNVPQADYEPITLLITPKKQQLITLNANYLLGKNTQIYTETGLSNNDVNMFSDVDNQKNKGLAYKLLINNTKLLSGNDSTGLKLKTGVSYEYVNQQFKPLERYRSVEFDRDFNLPISTIVTTATEKWTTAQVALFKSPLRQINYRISNFNRQNIYTGFMQSVNGNYDYKTHNINYIASVLNSNSLQNQSGTFLRQYLKYFKKFNNFETAFNFEQEQNKTKNTLTNNFTLQSFEFRQYQFVIQNTAKAINKFALGYTTRYDDLPFTNKLNAFSKGNIFTAKAEFNKNPNQVLAINTTYRTVKYTQTDSLKGNEQTLLGRIDYNFRALKGFINLSSFYELGTGREPKREFTYLEVQPGQGVYAWNDYNQNGIKELNEFEISRFPDQAKFIRIFRTTNQFIRSNFTGINQNLTLNASHLFKTKNNKLTGFIKKLSNITALRIDKRVLLSNDALAFNPYQTNVDDDKLLSSNSFFRNTLFFDRLNPIFSIDFNYQQNGSKVLLTNGFDSRNRNEYSLRIRWNFIRKANFTVEFKQGDKRYQSQLFINNNYALIFYDALPEFSYQFTNDFKTTFSGGVNSQKNNLKLGGQTTLNTRLSTEIKYNLLKKGVFSARLNSINNKFKGVNNTSVGYEMLDGLQPGNNLTWVVGFQRTIANGIQLNVNYEGRKAGDVRTIHTGGMQVRAFF